METKALNRLAVMATLHCLTGCAVGEILGNVIGSGLGWSSIATEIFTVPLAFGFGYGFTMKPLLGNGMEIGRATRLALASDSLSIATMVIVDAIIMMVVPGALAAGPTTALFWSSLLFALIVSFIVTVPVNRYLIARGKGHALIHDYHSHDEH